MSDTEFVFAMYCVAAITLGGIKIWGISANVKELLKRLPAAKDSERAQ